MLSVWLTRGTATDTHTHTPKRRRRRGTFLQFQQQIGWQRTDKIGTKERSRETGHKKKGHSILCCVTTGECHMSYNVRAALLATCGSAPAVLWTGVQKRKSGSYKLLVLIHHWYVAQQTASSNCYSVSSFFLLISATRHFWTRCTRRRADRLFHVATIDAFLSSWSYIFFGDRF